MSTASRNLALLLAPVLVGAAVTTASFDRKLSGEKRYEHALNRLTYGPADADAEAIRKMGVDKWVDRQLNPEKLPENPDLLKRLKLYDSLFMSTREIVENYPPPQVLNNLIRTNNFDAIKDPVQRARAERLAARRKKGKQQTDEGRDRRAALDQVLTLRQIQTLQAGTPAEKIALILSLDREQRDKLLAILPGAARNHLMHSDQVALRREAIAAVSPVQTLYHDLTEAKLLRAVHSTHQLEELMVDFWFNHFNVFFDKGFDRILVTGFERDAIRPHVWGNFKDLLLATARHPAMLFYLDNWTSVDISSAPRMRRKKQDQPQRRGAGLNENYARELLELHTMGVDNGYTQKDVTEVARCFTGWSIAGIRDGARFQFNPMLHDRKPKVVLGRELPSGRGEEDGLEVIEMLAKHPSTAKFIAGKLAQRFVSDNPPQPLVDRMAATFKRTNGNIREVMRTMLNSREFWSEGAYRSKIKMPLEFVASALRISGARVDSTVALNQTLQALGQPLYRKVEPTGYYPLAEEWTNSAALLARMNFGLDLAANKVRGIVVNEPSKMSGLAIGGPEFQRH